MKKSRFSETQIIGILKQVEVSLRRARVLHSASVGLRQSLPRHRDQIGADLGMIWAESEATAWKKVQIKTPPVQSGTSMEEVEAYSNNAI